MTAAGPNGPYHADSTGKPIHVGNIIRFRGRLYTITGFEEGAPMDVHYILVLEDLHTEERPTEISVDLWDQDRAEHTAWQELARRVVDDGEQYVGAYMTQDGPVDLIMRRANG